MMAWCLLVWLYNSVFCALAFLFLHWVPEFSRKPWTNKRGTFFIKYYWTTFSVVITMAHSWGHNTCYHGISMHSCKLNENHSCEASSSVKKQLMFCMSFCCVLNLSQRAIKWMQSLTVLRKQGSFASQRVDAAGRRHVGQELMMYRLQYEHVLDVKCDFETCSSQSKYFLRQRGWISFQSHTYLQGIHELWATEVTVFCFALLCFSWYKS